MTGWTFLTQHARVLLCVAHDPGVRLRDIAARLDVTERTAYGIITDLVEAGYVVKEKDGRRNRYEIQTHLPLPELDGRERTIGEGSRSPDRRQGSLERDGLLRARALVPTAATRACAVPGNPRTPR